MLALGWDRGAEEGAVMDTDLILTIGLLLGLFSIPGLLSAYSDNRSILASSLSVLVAGGCIAWALSQNPSGYALADVPEVMIEVFARVVR